MASLDKAYLDSLVKRFKGFKSPTDTQKLIITLAEKDDKSDDDIRKLSVLMRAEKKADQLVKARADARRLVDNEKTKARKTETRRKIVWISAIEKMAEDNPEYQRLLQQLRVRAFNEGYVADRDKDAVKADIGL